MADGANYSKRALLAPFRGAEKIGDCFPGVSLPLVAQPPANLWNAFGVQPSNARRSGDLDYAGL
jgi:hypothetical protein